MQFLNYFKASIFSPQRRSTYVAPIISSWFILFSGAVWGQSFISVIAGMLFMTAIILNYRVNSAPNLEAIFPVSHKKRLVYRFLSALFLFLIVAAAMLAVMLAAILLSLIFTLIFNGASAIDVNGIFKGIGNQFSSVGLYGWLFSVAYIIMLYSGGMIAGFIKRRKTRNIFLVCFCAFIFHSLMFMHIASFSAGGELNVHSPFKRESYTVMAFPWISTVFWCVVAAAFFGTAVYMGIKRFSPKKF